MSGEHIHLYLNKHQMVFVFLISLVSKVSDQGIDIYRFGAKDYLLC